MVWTILRDMLQNIHSRPFNIDPASRNHRKNRSMSRQSDVCGSHARRRWCPPELRYTHCFQDSFRQHWYVTAVFFAPFPFFLIFLERRAVSLKQPRVMTANHKSARHGHKCASGESAPSMPLGDASERLSCKIV